jgi:hypothetical protein
VSSLWTALGASNQRQRFLLPAERHTVVAFQFSKDEIRVLQFSFAWGAPGASILARELVGVDEDGRGPVHEFTQNDFVGDP